jgi:hypothetical protein
MKRIRQPAWPQYLIAASLVVFPLYEAIANNLLPIRLGDVRWRFGAFGVVSPVLLVVALGVMLVFWVANTYEHRGAQVVLGVGAVFLAALLLGAVGIFALDTVQVRGAVRPEAASAFHAASIVAAFRATLCAVAFGGLGVAAVRAGFAARSEEGRRGETRVPTPLVVGSVASQGIPNGANSPPTP